MATRLSNSSLTTLQTTYYDDYNESKQFVQILFRPAVAIQARELTQLQTVLQTQIQRFGDHVFKDGSIVDGVAITYHPKLPVTYLKDSFVTNTSLSIESIDGTYLLTNNTNSNTAVRAVVKVSKAGYLSTYPSTNRVYIDYIKTGKDGSNNDVNEFASNDLIRVYSSAQGKLSTLDANNLIDTIFVMTSNGTANATGYGYGISVTDGTIYQKGYFSKVNAQTITVKDHDTNPNGYVVGFETTESFITEAQDATLNDNALGFTNYRAPGAHRLKLTPTLVAKTRTDTANNKNFFAIAEFDNSVPTEQHDDAVYNKLGDEFSKRTYEESGDYVVKPFQIDTFASSNSSTMFYQVSPGIAYTSGYRVELIGAKNVEVDRAFTTDVSQNQIITANYGNYVVCDEFLGVYDFDKYGEVALYDTAQNSISEIEGISGAPAGSVVGYANVRSVLYSSGTKGTDSTLFLVFLSNIRMNSGKSFANDVKSIYEDNTYGKFRADIVLENGRAVLKDATKNVLVFPSGLEGTRRLTNNVGTNDTSFYYRQIASATLQSNGIVTYTINTPAAGGTERLGYSVGTLSDANEQEFNIILSANAYTANLTGTVTITSGNSTVIGTGTTFQTQLAPGGLFRIDAGAAIYTVNTIASNTTLTINQVPGSSYTTNVFQRFFVGGTVLPTANIEILSNTQFIARTGLTFDSGTQTTHGQYPIQRTTAVAATKHINKTRLVKIDCSNNAATSVGPWDLGLVDVAKVNAVYVGTTYANTNPERKSWFIFDNGQRDDMYDHGKLYVKPEFSSQITGSTKLLVDLDHFTTNVTAGIGFYSVDSYPISNTANSTTISYAEIPVFRSPTANTLLDLRNCVDFRALKHNTANSVANTDPANTHISINPAISNSSFNVPAAGAHLAEVDSNFECDLEYYLPRYDVLTINKNADLAVREGLPQIKPIVPFNDSDSSVLAEIYVPPFPSLTIREGDSYGRRDVSTRISIKTNRRYTMKDIGALEKRIKRLEYYTVLNAVEQQARDLTVPDVNGLNRFKNGIFADPFNSHVIGNVNDIEYKIAIDKDKSIARPFFKVHPVDFQYDANSSSGVTKTGPLITRAYSHEKYISQRFATKFRNTTQSIWQWNGNLSLYPSYDYYRSETTSPAINVELDFASPWEILANSAFGTIFGEWRASNNVVSTNTAFNGTTTTTSTTQQQIISTLNVDTLTNNYDFGSYVTDFSILPYIRPQVVAFVAYNVKPNTTLHAFFDDTNVDAYIAPGTLSGVASVESGQENRIVNQSNTYGSTLVSDASGFVCGHFKIPDNQFRVGDRQFRICDVNNLVTGANAIITQAVGTFSASNLSVTRRSISLTTVTPDITITSNTISRQITTTDFLPIVGERAGGDMGSTDPIAQSFVITAPTNVSGRFVTKLDLYFQAKDSTLGITVYLMEMRAGFPDKTAIVGKSYLAASAVNTSADGQTATTFTFEHPIYMATDSWYAFMIVPDGNSPEYKIWMGEVGGTDVFTGEQVYSNPYSGVAFISANMNTWTPIQTEDVKFDLYAAVYTVGTGTAVFNNEDDEYLTVDGFVRANASLVVEVGDVVYSVNSMGGATLTTNTSPRGIVQFVDDARGTIYLDSSNVGGFSSVTNPTIKIYRTADPANTSLIIANNLIATANITSVDNLQYHVVVPKFAAIEPMRTSLSYSFKGTNESYVTDSAYTTVINETDKEYLDISRYAVSKSNEVASMGSAKSSFFSVSMTTESQYVSPAIDLRKKASLFVQNIINSNNTNEHTKYGAASTKYVGKNVVLADGQEAEDLLVYVTGFRPVNTDIELYVKYLNHTDPENFDNKVWSKMSYQDGGEFVYSNPLDPTNYIEYKFALPAANLVAQGAYSNSTTGITEYTNAGGSLLLGFKVFAIKIVLLSTNPAFVPRLNDVRALALQI